MRKNGKYYILSHMGTAVQVSREEHERIRLREGADLIEGPDDLQYLDDPGVDEREPAIRPDWQPITSPPDGPRTMLLCNDAGMLVLGYFDHEGDWRLAFTEDWIEPNFQPKWWAEFDVQLPQE